jgi:hypothetical protein
MVVGCAGLIKKFESDVKWKFPALYMIVHYLIADGLSISFLG